MDKIIEGLISIENEAVLITREAEREKESLSGDIQTQTESIVRHVEQETAQAIQALYESARLECGRKMEDSNRRSQSREAELEREFAECHARWEDEIFKKIISR